MREPTRTTKPYRLSIDEVDDHVTSQLGKMGIGSGRFHVPTGDWDGRRLVSMSLRGDEQTYLSAQLRDSRFPGSPIEARTPTNAEGDAVWSAQLSSTPS